ncbi:TetR/AcrR family transcriptional regulator [Streptomyces odonnellii]|uniref:TetR/AcrR family transcriptional regulator n=1 Tax=Streptomyces odonnellii TaxID=1417980 RepID=UPI0006252648|nr:TetR/AcrR family transcriptional regulator [Streptomyces odonnellii]
MAPEADRAKRPTRTSVWLEGKPAGRGRKGDRTDRTERSADRSAARSARSSDQHGGLDRDRITTVSVRLLDTEGAAKFSMRRLAAELGVTAMSLYWYVDTKDDLLELALDRVFGEVRVPDLTDDATDWRDQLRELTASYRTVLVRHPWVSPLIGKYLNIGPHSTAFSAAVQAVVRRTGLAPHGQMGAISAVFQFVYGFGTIEGHFVQRCADAGVSQDEYYRQATGVVSEQPRFKAPFGNAEEIMAARGDETVVEMRQRDFTFAVELLIAGIEAMRARG